MSKQGVKNNKWFWRHIVCPDCKSALSISDNHIRCNNCKFQRARNGKLDLRPVNPKMKHVPADPLPPDCELQLHEVDTSSPAETYTGPPAARISTGFMSEMSRLLPRGSSVLDVGCGPRDQAVPIEYLGFKYVGFDIAGNNPDFHGDAHAIPFADAVFDCVFSYAVLEHLHNPGLAFTEFARVLKPGGIVIGSVSQGEPFHASYYHMTSWGVISLCRVTPSLVLKRLWGTEDTLWSLGTMGRYPKVVKILIRLVHRIHKHLPFLAPRRLRWTDLEKRIDSIYRSGNMCFLLSKLNR